MNYVTRGQKVMVADNDRAVLEMLQIRLDVAGYHTLAARTGQAAIDMIRNVRPDVMVLDLGLPDIDAFEILAAIGGDGRRPQFPVLVVGKTLSADTIRRAIQLGARDCMAKPFSGADLLERVERLLRKPAAAPTAPALKVRYVSH
jgi:DNA-binding response OmpR family regulator